MQIDDETHLAEMGASIREIYTGGEPFADHLADSIRSIDAEELNMVPGEILCNSRHINRLKTRTRKATRYLATAQQVPELGS
ncbi:hypothetical protein MTP99_004254 [Tenebrio molitor]|nr:hypothetical protein MTP99_004254 [Tenebrio molitor]